ncbi:protein-protein interaction regulator family protein [Striga asiatica]|uniref:Protein-protein interaction regulator family protein n=1 Tax=Striga asiatica TaxID=4170 RepID=A0A5A7Q993_STRAF|nr:protein-protein interaction regulator family protein [Striga asiatica]
MQMRARARFPVPLVKLPVPDTPKTEATSAPTPIWQMIICTPPSRNRSLRPNLSTVKMETKVASTLTSPVTTADMSDASSPKPRDRRVEHDYVDPRELLEERDEERDHELGTVLCLQDRAERLLNLLGRLTGLHQVLVLGVHARRASDLLEHGARALALAPLDQGVWGVGEEDCPDGHHEGGGACQGEGDAPPVGGHLGGAVVDEVGGEDADGDGHLEADVKGPAKLVGGHLGEVDGDGLGDAVEDGTEEEDDPAGGHRDLASELASGGRGEEGGHQGRQVEGRRKEGQEVILELAVLALAPAGFLFLLVHFGEEFLQELVH